MNIKEAKEQIRNAIIAYFTTDEYGDYEIATEDQRPVFLMGPPGIGKTAIMQQIATELGIGLVSYSMTHHTRQSALGLPFIQTKKYGDKEYSVSEYTMSEIIASVYDTMEETGVDRGILFLDEINCVSETLAPSMLQFLQYKMFGRHRVPDGWIVVTAGNPPEYNNSVREFDTVTWDRMKRIDIEPDYRIWKEYAADRGVHPSVSTYLDIKTGDFYKVESTVEGKSIVTARAWLNLSDMIRLYEKNHITVDEKMIGQYLQDKKVAKSFANYYDLFNKYRSDYQIDDILSGKASETVRKRARTAKYDERLSLLGLILDKVGKDLRQAYYEEQILLEQKELFGKIKAAAERNGDAAQSSGAGAVYDLLCREAAELKDELETGKKTALISDDRRRILHGIISDLDNSARALAEAGLTGQGAQSDEGKAALDVVRGVFNARRADYRALIQKTDAELENMFLFAEDVFPDGQEMLIIVTELTKGFYSAHYISRHGCRKYFAHNKELLFYERQTEIVREIENLEL
ncbi:MAG: AAA family ATPase [Mogibacterium sp.]|nr:AAA family ATPase [Mogibacterium sp.]